MFDTDFSDMALSDLALVAILKIDQAIDRPNGSGFDLSVLSALAARLEEDLQKSNGIQIPHRLALYLSVLPNCEGPEDEWTLDAFTADLEAVKNEFELLSQLRREEMTDHESALEKAYEFCVRLRDVVSLEEMKGLDQYQPLARDPVPA